MLKGQVQGDAACKFLRVNSARYEQATRNWLARSVEVFSAFILALRFQSIWIGANP